MIKGTCAEYTFVSARLIIGNQDFGIHGFLVKGTPAGMERESMPEKAALRGLDNGVIRFKNVRIPVSALLSRHTHVLPDGR